MESDIGIKIGLSGLTQYQAGLNAAERATSRTAGKVSGVLSGVTKGQGSAFSSLSGNISGVAGSLATLIGPVGIAAAGIAALAAAFRDAVGVAASFQQQIADVGAIQGLDRTSAGFQAITEEAKRLGVQTEFSATQAASAMEFLARAGFDTNQVLAATEDTLALATVGSLDLARAADIASDVLTTFGEAPENLGRVVDIISATTVSANTDVQQFADAINYLGATAKSLNVSLEESAAVIGTVSDAGLKGSLGTRALGTALVRLTAPTAAAADEIERLNLDLFQGGEFVGIIDTIGQLEKAYADLTPEQQAASIATIFGAEAFQEVNILLQRGSESLKEYRSELEAAGNENGEFSRRIREIKLDTFEGSVKLLQSAIEGFKIELAAGSLPVLKELNQVFAESIRAVTSLLAGTRSLGDFFPRFREPIEELISAFTEWKDLITTELLLPLDLLGERTEGIGGIIETYFVPAVRLAIQGLTNFARTQTAVLGVLAEVFGFLTAVGAELRDFASAVGDVISEFSEAVGITDLFRAAVGQLRILLSQLGFDLDSIATGFSDFTLSIDQVRAAASGTFAAVLRIIRTFAADSLTVLQGLGDYFVGLLTFDFDQLSSGLSQIIDGLSTGIGELGSNAIGDFTTQYQKRLDDLRGEVDQGEIGEIGGEAGKLFADSFNDQIALVNPSSEGQRIGKNLLDSVNQAFATGQIDGVQLDAFTEEINRKLAGSLDSGAVEEDVNRITVALQNLGGQYSSLLGELESAKVAGDNFLPLQDELRNVATQIDFTAASLLEGFNQPGDSLETLQAQLQEVGEAIEQLDPRSPALAILSEQAAEIQERISEVRDEIDFLGQGFSVPDVVVPLNVDRSQIEGLELEPLVLPVQATLPEGDFAQEVESFASMEVAADTLGVSLDFLNAYFRDTGEVIDAMNGKAFNFASELGLSNTQALALSTTLQDIGGDLKTLGVDTVTDAFVGLGEAIGNSLTQTQSFADSMAVVFRNLVSTILVEVPKLLGVHLLQTAVGLGFPAGVPFAIAGIGLLAFSGVAAALLSRIPGAGDFQDVATPDPGGSTGGSRAANASAGTGGSVSGSFETPGLGNVSTAGSEVIPIVINFGNEDVTRHFTIQQQRLNGLRG